MTTDYELGYACAEQVCRGYDMMDENEQCAADYQGELMEVAFLNDPLCQNFSEEWRRGYRAAWAYWS
jgi:hypothetical protein